MMSRQPYYYKVCISELLYFNGMDKGCHVERLTAIHTMAVCNANQSESRFVKLRIRTYQPRYLGT